MDGEVNEDAGTVESLRLMETVPSYSVEPVKNRYVDLVFEDEHDGYRVEVRVEHPTAQFAVLKAVADAGIEAALQQPGPEAPL